MGKRSEIVKNKPNGKIKVQSKYQQNSKKRGKPDEGKK